MSTSVSHEWISVDDRLPEHPGDVVIMWRKAGFERWGQQYPSFPGTCYKGQWFVIGDDDVAVAGVTHWQPLPATRPAIPQPPAPKPQKMDRW